MKCAVLGDPIDHSLSPALHRAGYLARGLDWSYAAATVPAGGLADFVAGLDESWRGLSLTMPLKREALALVADGAGSVTPLAALAGGANTLVFGQPGGVVADNTDVPGMVAAIGERYAGPLDRVAVWGGGATAAAGLVAAAELGCSEAVILVRDAARAAETLAVARRLEAAGSRLRVRVGALGDQVRADLLLSTIPALPQESLVESIADVGAVFDVLYHPWPTPLARWASGRPLIGGLDLLVHQAALQFTLFTGEPAPLSAMRAAGELALRERVLRG
ncbi:MAG: shikimate dehydrogenase [Nocardioides sp.]